MAISVTPILGADLNNTLTASQFATLGSGVKYPPVRLGMQVWGDDGKQYVFAIAGGAIPASTAVCTVNPASFAATSSGGSYTSPATAMATGDYGWFAKASV